MYPNLKRLMDITIAITAILLFLPISLILMLLISIEDGGLPVYYHERVGRGRKPFNLFKFRSMVKNADELLFSDPEFLKKMRTGNHKLSDDPRVTRIGRFIRKFSIDEFPQFINVLVGDMSFVGPRPFRPDEIEKYEKSKRGAKLNIDTILSVKPGITGFWQIGGRSDVSFDDRIKIELEYVENCSLSTDLYIILKTPIAVLKARGAS